VSTEVGGDLGGDPFEWLDRSNDTRVPGGLRHFCARPMPSDGMGICACLLHDKATPWVATSA